MSVNEKLLHDLNLIDNEELKEVGFGDSIDHMRPNLGGSRTNTPGR